MRSIKRDAKCIRYEQLGDLDCNKFQVRSPESIYRGRSLCSVNKLLKRSGKDKAVPRSLFHPLCRPVCDR